MNSTSVNGLTLYYDEEGEYALDLVREACVQSIRIMQDSWHLNTCLLYTSPSPRDRS